MIIGKQKKVSTILLKYWRWETPTVCDISSRRRFWTRRYYYCYYDRI